MSLGSMVPFTNSKLRPRLALKMPVRLPDWV